MDTPTDSSEESKNYIFDGTTYTYTDPKTNKSYLWDLDKKEWIDKSEDSSSTAPAVKSSNSDSGRKETKNDEEENDSEDDDEKPKAKTQDMSQGTYGYEGDTYLFTHQDGTVYFWDKEKNAWFPKIDDTFIAMYQMGYGFTDNTTDQKTDVQPNTETSETCDKSKETEKVSEPVAEKRKIQAEPPKWFDIDDEHNTKVYVTNLPLDITEAEFAELMQKCGLVMKDLDTGKMKVKLYADPVTKELKGDALCTYIKKESVVLALQMLDGYDVRGHQIKVERAQFQMKGNAYDPNLKPKKRRRKDKEKMKKIQDKLFAWQPDKLRGERPKNERVVVIKNMFDPTEFDKNLGLILEYQQDIREECSKCGSVKKVVVYDKHEEGVAQVWFKEAEAADACINLLNNRWFSQRLIKAETWDGKTRYRVQETPEEAEIRLKNWEKYLNSSKENDQNDDATSHPKNNDGTEKDYDSEGTRSSAGSGDETDEETKAK